MRRFGQDVCGNLEGAVRREWRDTNAWADWHPPQWSASIRGNTTECR